MTGDCGGTQGFRCVWSRTFFESACFIRGGWTCEMGRDSTGPGLYPSSSPLPALAQPSPVCVRAAGYEPRGIYHVSLQWLVGLLITQVHRWNLSRPGSRALHGSPLPSQ